MHFRFIVNKEHNIILLRQMLSLQLLITCRFPNVIREDYFTRLGNINPTTDIRYLKSERILIDGELNLQKLSNLPKMINFLALNLSDTFYHDLNDYKLAFQKKFEHREVPIAIVMDPEIGVGYGNLEQHTENDALSILKTVKMERHDIINTTYSNLHAFILYNLTNFWVIKILETKHYRTHLAYYFIFGMECQW